jgi:hypothetical protein
MLIDVILIAVAAVLVGVYVSWRAGRLDRLHARVDGARAALDAALVRRSSVALELAACGWPGRRTTRGPPVSRTSSPRAT